ncbi:MAG: glutamate--tRNA ligase [Acidobacteriota bacterium]
MSVRVRFAPSPTGYLHVGGARTALINWLFARRHEGCFVLRVEDTDEARSTPEMTQVILDGLAWLGITWDEGPFLQSERSHLYRETARRLLDAGSAYRCFCSKEALAERRSAAGKPEEWKYDRRCRGLDRTESDARAASGEPFVVRCAVPDEPLQWDDVVKGPIRFEPGEVEDFILLRSDGTPTYHLSVVSDDAAMGITHVIRGEDHVSNTPKQIALYKGLGLAPPVFGHLPLILGMDKRKLSKRHGTVSVLSYRDEGILPLALFNYLAQMGANLGEEPCLPVEEILRRFDLDSLKKSPSVFDREQLRFVNAKILGETPTDELGSLLPPFLAAEGLAPSAIPEPAVAVLKTRAHDLRELAAWMRPFLTEVFPYDEKGRAKALKDPAALPAVASLAERLAEIPEADWTPARLEEVLRRHAEACGIKAGALIHPVRLFLTGRSESPGIFDVLWAMGKPGTLSRLQRGVRELGPANS